MNTMETDTMELYHYTECGLDNVWLEGGFERQDFGGYGSAVAVHDENGLWKVIGRGIVRQDRRMMGQELRFLRTQMGWTQTELGKRLGYGDGQIVAKWEKACRSPVPVIADTFVRAAYTELSGDERPMITRVNARLLEISNIVSQIGRRVLAEEPGGPWVPKEAPAEMAFALT